MTAPALKTRIVNIVHASERVLPQKKAINADMTELDPRERKPWQEAARPRCEGNRSSERSVRLGVVIDIPSAYEITGASVQGSDGGSIMFKTTLQTAAAAITM